jgi:hypothetical protein
MCSYEIRGNYPHQYVDGKFWLVVSGAAYARGGGENRDSPKLQKAGETLHSTLISARREAERLARVSPGTPFYVVEAIHVAQTNALSSRAL